MEPIVSFVQDTTFDVFSKTYHSKISGLASALPVNVHLLTLEQWNNGQFLIRLEHFYQKDEHPDLSKPVAVNLKKLFKQFDVIGARELTLGANQDISATKNRMKFKYTPVGQVFNPKEGKFNADTLEVTLTPMQIRTFVVSIKRN